MANLEHIREQNRWKPKSAEQPLTKKELPYMTIVLMFCLAGLFDAGQAILSLFAIGLVLSPFISIFAGMSFWFWFSTYEISFMDWKRLTALIGGGVAELIPAVDALPFWIGVVWYIISTTKVKEVTSHIPGGKVLSNVTKK